MRSVLVVATLALLASAASSLAQDSSPADQHAQKAFELVQSGDLKGAEAELRKAIELSPDDPALLTSLGGILGMEGNLKQANVYLAEAVKLKPDDPLLRRNLAANEWQLGLLQEAEENLEPLVRANPEDKRAVFLLGMVCEGRKNYARSIALLESIPDIIEQQPEALVALASSYYHSNRHDDGQLALQRLLGRSVTLQVMLMAGHVAMEARDYTLAESLLAKGTQAFPDSYKLFAMKGSAEMKLQYFNSAVSSFEKAAGLHPSSEMKRELALAEWRAGNRTQAASEFEEILRRFPHDAQIYEVYGALLLEDASPGDKIRATKLLKQALEIDNSSVDARYELANLELSDGHFTSASQYLERAIKIDPGDSRLYFALSRAYRRLGRDSMADRELDKFQKLKKAEQPGPPPESALGVQH